MTREIPVVYVRGTVLYSILTLMILFMYVVSTGQFIFSARARDRCFASCFDIKAQGFNAEIYYKKKQLHDYSKDWVHKFILLLKANDEKYSFRVFMIQSITSF